MHFKRTWLNFAVTIFVAVVCINTACAEVSLAENSFQDRLRAEEQILKEQNFSRWTWLNSSCHNCQMVIQTRHPELRTEKVQLFMQALSVYKNELLALYPQVHGEEYNLLAHMAIGILGRESQFFQSNRYYFKETFPWAVSLMKVMQIYLAGKEGAPSPNSRGPTQIKIVPSKIAAKYGVTSETLQEPQNAALATMGYLLDALPELKNRARNNNWDFVVPKTYPDYLPYIYFGSIRSLFNRTATPDKNIYIQDMRKYMGWVQIYQRPVPFMEPLSIP